MVEATLTSQHSILTMNTASLRIRKILFAAASAPLLLLYAGLAQEARAQTATTTNATSTESSTNDTPTATSTTAAPMISLVSAVPTSNGTGATISWLTDEPGSSQVFYGTTETYGSSTQFDQNLTVNHTVGLTELAPNTLYHFQVMSWNASSSNNVSSDLTFTTANPETQTMNDVATSTTTTTATSTTAVNEEIEMLRARISALEGQVDMILGDLAKLLAQVNSMATSSTETSTGTTPTATSTPPAATTSGGATISPDSANIRGGGSIDFAGRGFGIEEDVTISSDGVMIGRAHADGGGNFTTGSLSIPSTTGTKTYTFTGMNSGRTVTVMLTITQ